jgi:hypothetical protein
MARYSPLAAALLALVLLTAPFCAVRAGAKRDACAGQSDAAACAPQLAQDTTTPAETPAGAQAADTVRA